MDKEPDETLCVCALRVMLVQAPHKRHYSILVPPPPIQLLVLLQVREVFVHYRIQIILDSPLEMSFEHFNGIANIALPSLEEATTCMLVCQHATVPRDV